MASYVLFLLLFSQIVYGNEVKSGFMDGLNTGMKFAKEFLGSESVALKVAEFVVRAFQTADRSHSKPNRRRPINEAYEDASNEEYVAYEKPNYDVNEAPSPIEPLRHLVRLFGLQPKQLSAVAVNALVFVAQMISTFFSNPRRPERPYRMDDPSTWLLSKNSRKLQELLATAKNESLPDIIEDLIKEQGSEEEISCIRLLFCKITPFLYKMQDVVFGDDNELPGDGKEVRGSAVLYRHIPTASEVNSRSEICEQRYKDCDLNE